LIYLKTTYQVETGDYTGDIASIDVSYKDLNISTRALNHFTNGMKALQMQDAATLDSITTLMTAERLLDEERVSGSGVQTCGSTNSSVPDALDIQYARVMELELKGMLASMRGNMQEADMLLKQAVDEEISASYAYGPPSIVKPSYELYAEWLMDQGRTTEALAQYTYALKVFPNRLLLLKGKAQAEKAMEVG
jgi:tetratricopeptide (TPR) repeat protein